MCEKEDLKKKKIAGDRILLAQKDDMERKQKGKKFSHRIRALQ